MWKGTFVLLALFLFFPATVLAQQGASVEVLTLDRAVTLALDENHGLKNAELEVEKAEGVVAAARTYRLPALHVYARVAQQFVKQDVNLENPLSNLIPGIDPFFSVSVPRRPTVTIAGVVIQPLSQQYKIGLGIDLARLARDAEREKARQVRQVTVERVKLAYFGILQTQSALASIEESIGYYRELDRVTGESVARQVLLKANALEVKTRLAKAEYESLSLTNHLATQKERLNELLGRDPAVEFKVAPVPDPNEAIVDLAFARRLALARRPEIAEANIRVRQAELDRRLKKSEFIPDVSVGLTVLTLRNFDPVIPRNFAGVNVLLKWEVFDWGRKRHQLAEKDRTIEQARNHLREAEDLIRIEVGDTFRKIRLARQALEVARMAQETAREVLRVNTDKFKYSEALFSDVLQSQAVLAEADHQYQQALLGYFTARAEFEKALGQEK